MIDDDGQNNIATIASQKLLKYFLLLKSKNFSVDCILLAILQRKVTKAKICIHILNSHKDITLIPWEIILFVRKTLNKCPAFP